LCYSPPMRKRTFKPEWRKRINAVCVTCGKPFKAVEAEVKRGRGRCCSAGCAAALTSIKRDQKGRANNNWRGGDSGTQRKRRYRVANPVKHAAHLALTKAVRLGLLVRLPCDLCGNAKTEGHHVDYSAPLSVVWLCKKHHLAAHGGRLDNHR
jgi:hypothetical protein